MLHGFAEGGGARFVLSGCYADADQYRRRIDALRRAAERAGL